MRYMSGGGLLFAGLVLFAGMAHAEVQTAELEYVTGTLSAFNDESRIVTLAVNSSADLTATQERRFELDPMADVFDASTETEMPPATLAAGDIVTVSYIQNQDKAIAKSILKQVPPEVSADPR